MDKKILNNIIKIQYPSYIELLKSMQHADRRRGKKKEEIRGFRVRKMKKSKHSSRFSAPPEHRDHFRFMKRLQKIRLEDKRRHKKKILKKKMKTSMQKKELDTRKAIEFLREIYKYAEYSIREPSPSVAIEKSNNIAQYEEKKNATRKRKKKKKKKTNSFVELPCVEQPQQQQQRKASKDISKGLCTTTELVLDASSVSHRNNAYPTGSIKISPSSSSSPRAYMKPSPIRPSPTVVIHKSDDDDKEKDDTILDDKDPTSLSSSRLNLKRAIQTPGFGAGRGPLDFSPSPWTPAQGGTQGFGKIQWSRGSQGVGVLMCSREL